MNTTNITPRITEESLKPISSTISSPAATSYLPSYFSDIKVIAIVILIIVVILLIFYIFKIKPNEQEKKAHIQAEQDLARAKNAIRNRLHEQQQQRVIVDDEQENVRENVRENEQENVQENEQENVQENVQEEEEIIENDTTTEINQ